VWFGGKAQYFGEIYRFHLQGKIVSQEKINQEAVGKRSSSYSVLLRGFLGLLFDPEDADGIIFRNIRIFVSYMAVRLTITYSS
jgi:hypothetical protein